MLVIEINNFFHSPKVGHQKVLVETFCSPIYLSFLFSLLLDAPFIFGDVHLLETAFLAGASHSVPHKNRRLI
jgi:hypothetical protein